MNIREIAKPEIKSTLITMDKIFKENPGTSSRALLVDLSPDMATPKLVENGFRFFSAFENGGEIGTVALKGNHICVVAVKKYAQKRGVGSELLSYVLKLFPKGSKVTVNADPNVVSFYTRLGFSPIDPADPIVKKDGLTYIPMAVTVK